MVAAKKERNQIIKQVFASPEQPLLSTTHRPKDPIEIQCDLYAIAIMALPPDLQKNCKREIQAIINKYEDMAEEKKSDPNA